MNLEMLDRIRIKAKGQLDPQKKSALGQFMTPSIIAEFMANLFSEANETQKLLDAGAGIGSLTIAAARKLKKVQLIEVWEIDQVMRSYLSANLDTLRFPYLIHDRDFIIDSVVSIAAGTGTRFTHAILNPPYKKINSDSPHRLMLRKVGIETVNLYTAFLSLTILLMEKNGQIVAIIPRSWCNGPYYHPFRAFLLNRCSIDHIHVFESRDQSFRDDEVLQENVIIKLTVGVQKGEVIISRSKDPKMHDYCESAQPFSKIVKDDDEESFIHIPANLSSSDPLPFSAFSLEEIGIEVSTGPVVDFRLRTYWEKPSPISIPLIYPHHFIGGEFRYPVEHKKKPNALKPSKEIKKWLMPNDYYVIVKRFSAKEEKRRVVAYIFDPSSINAEQIGFENHWNVFHWKKKGLNPLMAHGLACYLNSTQFDKAFRSFSGHTQVNATDLRNMHYPNVDVLESLGEKYKTRMSQANIDSLILSIKDKKANHDHHRTKAQRGLFNS